MKFKCDRDVLSEALQIVQRAVSSRPGIPALTGVLMNASGSQLVLATTDLEVSARLVLEVQVQQEGVALVPAPVADGVTHSRSDARVFPPFMNKLLVDGRASWWYICQDRRSRTQERA